MIKLLRNTFNVKVVGSSPSKLGLLTYNSVGRA